MDHDDDSPPSAEDIRAYFRFFPPRDFDLISPPARHVVSPGRRFRTKVRTGLGWVELFKALNLPKFTPLSKGIEGRTICVFHDERSPSLILWRDGRFACMGCGEVGDMTDFVVLLLDNKQAEGLTLRQLKTFFNDNTSLRM